MRPGLFLAVALPVALLALPARADGDLVLDLGGATLETRHVTHGSFVQGSAPSDPAHEKDEEPAHQVTITHDFWMGKFPVTRGQFAKFVADTRYVTDAEKGASGGAGWDGKGLVQKKDFTWKNPGFTQTDEHPVVLVSYGDASAFTGWASRKTGKRVRLPTEAEWEFAARGGTATPWYGGSTEAENAGIGWFKSNAGNGTRPVGQKKANPLGLFDMSGNVFEWCRDIYGPYHDAAAIDPELTTNTGAEPERRVLRGGSWLRDIKRARSSDRYRNAPGSRNADNGFRVVVTNEEPVAPGVNGSTTDFAPANPVGIGAGAGAGPAATAGGHGATSGPLADGEPVRLDPIAHSSDAFSWGLLLVSPLAAASAVVAWMLLRRKRSPRVAAAVTPSGVSTRASEDGFFVRAPNASPGSRARYECLVNGTQVTDVVPLAGDETFVYTGSPPTGIRIVEIVAAPRGYRVPDRPPAQAGIDAGLIPPSSRPRPPPVPPRRAAATATAPMPALLHTHTHTTTTHRESPLPMMVPVVNDPVSSAVVPPSSGDVSASTDPAPPSSAASAVETLSRNMTAAAESGASTAAASDAGTSEAFLGNPRAY